MSGGGSSLWKRNAELRLSVVAESEFDASLQKDAALEMFATGGARFPQDVIFDGRTSHPLELDAVGASTPVSDLFGTEGEFSSLWEDFWGTIWEGGAASDDYLIENYQHSETPVKYVRLDDITLEYTGTQLTRVTKEEGDEKLLEYSGSQLVRVTDTYVDTIKDLTYSGNQLTGVTVSKIV